MENRKVSRATARRGAVIKQAHPSIGTGLSSGATAVLVLGSYRSGITALAGMIRLLGADLPPDGHSSSALAQINDEIAAAASAQWRDWRTLDQSLRSTSAAPLLKEQALNALRTNFASSRLFVVHDPLICRFVPFWCAILDEFKVRPVVILLVRNPIEVADSVHRQHGINGSTSCLLWLRHMLDGEHASRDLPRAVVTHDDLLSNWPGVIFRLQAELGLRWPRRSDLATLEIERFLKPTLAGRNVDRTHLHADRAHLPPQAEEWLVNCYEAMIKLSGGRLEKEAVAQLDRIRVEFDRACAIFGPLLSGLESDLAAYRGPGNDARTDEELKNADEGTRQLYYELKDSNLFDRRWYLQSYPDARNTKLDALLHYLRCGAAEGRAPNPFFDTGWYLERNPDVKSAGINPLFHYLHYGAAEGRDPSPLFATEWYRQENPDVAATGLSPLAHYLKIGSVQGRRPKPAT